MPSSGLELINGYKHSLDVKWRHMYDTPPDVDLYKYYSYNVKYRKKDDDDWISGPVVPYNPNDNPPQATIDELTSHTEYQVRILGVRSKEKQTDEETADKTDVKTFGTLLGTCLLFFGHVLFDYRSYAQ